MKPYEKGLERNEANYTPLTPVSFLAKAAYVRSIPRGKAGDRSTARCAAQRGARCTKARAPALRLGASRSAGVERGDTVAAMLPNIPAMIELHFGPAMFGAVLNTLNTRLEAEALAFMLDHGEAKFLFTDREFSRDRDQPRRQSASPRSRSRA